MHEIPLFYAGFSDSEDEKNLFFPPRLPVWEDFLLFYSNLLPYINFVWICNTVHLCDFLISCSVLGSNARECISRAYCIILCLLIQSTDISVIHPAKPIVKQIWIPCTTLDSCNNAMILCHLGCLDSLANRVCAGCIACTKYDMLSYFVFVCRSCWFWRFRLRYWFVS